MKKQFAMKKLVIAAMMLVMIGVGNVVKADMILPITFTYGDFTFSAGYASGGPNGHYILINCLAENSNTSGQLIIPSTVEYNGEPYYVEVIKDNAFKDCTGLTGVVLPDHLREIGSNAFSGCTELDGDLEIPAMVTTIKSLAFNGCSGIDHVYFYAENCEDFDDPNISSQAGQGMLRGMGIPHTPSTNYNPFIGVACPLYIGHEVRRIPGFMFRFSSLTTLEFLFNTSNTNALEEIGSYAFDKCSSLAVTDLTIPKGVKTIGKSAFNECTLLSGALSIPVGMELIDNKAFCNCTGFEDVYFDAEDCAGGYGGVLSLLQKKGQPESRSRLYGEGSFGGCTGKLHIGTTVQKINDYIFNNAAFDGTLSIPSNVRSIGKAAFCDCEGFTGTLIIPSQITTISDEAFSGCTHFQGLELHDGITDIGRAAFWRFGSAYDNGIGELSLPNSIVIINDGTFRESGFSGLLDIPNSVKQIGENAFDNCSKITSVKLNQVVSIGQYAFRGTGLQSIDWGAKLVSRIERYAFASCYDLETLTIPASIKYIGFAAFTAEDTGMAMTLGRDYDNSLPDDSGVCDQTPLTLNFEMDGSRLTTIEGRAFWGRCGITGTLSLPSTVTTIGVCAFAGCGFTGCLNLPASVQSIGERAFALCKFDCIDLPSDLVDLEANAFEGSTWYNDLSRGVIYLNEWVLGYKGEPDANENLVIVALPGGGQMQPSTKYIANRAFANRTDFTGTLTLPATLEKIGDFAFAGCRNLHGTLTIPVSLKTMGRGAFCYRSDDNSSGMLDGISPGPGIDKVMQFDALVFSNPTQAFWTLKEIPEYAFTGCDRLANTLTLPNSIQSIGNCAFASCTRLTGSLSIPNNVTSIGYEAFEFCSGFNGTLTIPASMCEIKSRAFYQCTNLTELVFESSNENPSRLNTIGYSAFEGCSGIVADPLVIPDNVKRIESQAFYNCEKICSFTIGENIEYIGENAFYGTCWYNNINEPSVVYLGNWVIGLKGDATSIIYLMSQITTQEHQYRIEYIADRAFSGKSISGITIPSSIKSIGLCAFSGCSNLSSVVFAGTSSLKTIGGSAFSQCTSLSEVTIPKSVVTINGYAFEGCSGMQSLTFETGSNLKTIGWSAFTGCSNITTPLSIPEGVTTIQTSAFENCSRITELTLPNTLLFVDQGAFRNTGISDFSIPYSVLDLAGNAFNDTPWYEGLADGAIYKDNCFMGFKGDHSVESISFMLNTRLIAGYIGCRNLKGKLTIPMTIEGIGSSAFESCDGLNELKFEKNSSLTYIGNNTFSGCGFFGDLVIPNSVTIIGESAFNSCENFSNWDLVLPYSLDSLGGYAFMGCGFNRIFCPFTTPPTMIDDRHHLGDEHEFFDNYDATVYIPKDISTILFQDEEEWAGFSSFEPAAFFKGHDGNLANNWARMDVAAQWVGNVAAFTDFAVIIEDCNMTAPHTVHDFYLAKGIDFRIKSLNSRDLNSRVLTVTGVMENRGDASNLVLEDGTQLVHNSEGVSAIVIKKTEASTSTSDPKWAFIASPMVDELDPQFTIPDDFERVMYRFNQAPAAPDYLEWENLTNHIDHPNAKIINGQGYLYAHKKHVVGEIEIAFDYSFSGELMPSNDYKNVELEYNDEEHQPEDGHPCNPDPNMRGWNLVGNPFPCDAYVNRSYHAIISDSEGHQYIDETPTSMNVPIPPCTGIMVKANGIGEEVSFTRIASTQQSTNFGCLSISLLNGEPKRGAGTIDHATVSFNEGDELQKLHFLTGDAKIYIPQGEKQYAIAVAEQEGELPLNFEAYKNGVYTLSITPDRAEVEYLHLIDNMTGANVDLLANPSYTFEATTRDYASRFRLVFSPNEEGGASTGSATFAYFNGSEWVIANDEGATLQVVDMMGRVLVSRDAVNRISTSGLAPGVYVLRLVSGENVKVQKVVIE